MLLAGTDPIRNGHGREDEDTRKLHLSDAARLRMGRASVRYFQAMYGITPCLADRIGGRAEDRRHHQGKAGQLIPLRQASMDSCSRKERSWGMARGKGGWRLRWSWSGPQTGVLPQWNLN